MSICVLRTHVIDHETLDLLSELRREMGRDRVFVLFDNTNRRWPVESLEIDLNPKWYSHETHREALDSGESRETHREARVYNTLIFDDADCISLNSMHNKGYGGKGKASWSFWHPETSYVMMYDFIIESSKENIESRNENFEYVWFIEYDVRCSGSFKKAFKLCDDVKGDFMACGGSEGQCRVRRASEDPSWCWWQYVEGGISSVEMKDRVGVFFPMTRLSRAMFEALRGEFGRSTGFCEVYFPTLCLHSGLLLTALPSQVIGKFRYRPTIDHDEWSKILSISSDHRFFHPVKASMSIVRVVSRPKPFERPKFERRKFERKVDGKQRYSSDLYENIECPGRSTGPERSNPLKTAISFHIKQRHETVRPSRQIPDRFFKVDLRADLIPIGRRELDEVLDGPLVVEDAPLDSVLHDQNGGESRDVVLARIGMTGLDLQKVQGALVLS